MIRKFLLSFLLWVPYSFSDFEFKGTHYLASYKECNQSAIENIHQLFAWFLIAVNNSGAHILQYYAHPFGIKAVTGMAILSESHASIHTYPEHRAVFVDLFTCGERSDWKKFEDSMVEACRPKIIERQIIERH